ncbi:hypothetical protein L1887_41865 [Cichorium endivia]|nr:hypothetical protein L1887_41865 [Cichorium endivia]
MQTIMEEFASKRDPPVSLSTCTVQHSQHSANIRPELWLSYSLFLTRCSSFSNPFFHRKSPLLYHFLLLKLNNSKPVVGFRTQKPFTSHASLPSSSPFFINTEREGLLLGFRNGVLLNSTKDC